MRTVLTVLLFVITASAPADAAILRVDIDVPASGNGSSWANAYQYLDEALAAAGPNDEIWVAEGVYTPTRMLDRDASFVLKAGVPVLGGFSGVETSADERDPAMHVTVLSGDIGAGGDASDNCYHVVRASATDFDSVLDGFTIEDGNANGGNPLFDPRSFGGGIRVSSSQLTVTRCVFRQNLAQGGGAAIALTKGDLVVSRCWFMDNNPGSTVGTGGAVHVTNLSQAAILNCGFDGNSASTGGALANNDSSTLLVNCVFTDNTSQLPGGAIAHVSGMLDIVNCTFARNQALADAGAGGAALYATDGAGVAAVNSIFWDNADSGPLDSLTQISDGGTPPTVTYSCVEDEVSGDAAVYPGAGNIDLDPAFVDSLTDLRLAAGSPCVDAGDNDSLPADDFDMDDNGDSLEPLPLDLDERRRRTNDGATPDTGNAGAAGPPIVDMGAYELRAFSCIMLIDPPSPMECVGAQTVVLLDGSTSSDPDGNPLTYDWSVANCPEGVLANTNDSFAELTMITSNGCNVSCEVTLTLDNGTDTFDCTETITIQDTTPPNAVDDSVPTDEDTPIVDYDVRDNDSDAGAPIPLTIVAVTNPMHGTVMITSSGTAITYTPDPDYSGPDLFEYTVEDDSGNQDTATFEVGVIPVADEPSLAVSDAEGDEDTAIPLDVVSQLSDNDGSELLSFIIDGVPAGAQLSAGVDNGGGSWALADGDEAGLTVTPPTDDNADFILTVTAVATEQDNLDAASTNGLINVTVHAVNDAPVVTAPGPLAVDEDTPLSITSTGVADVDVDEGTGIVQMTLTVARGTVSLAGTNGLTFSQGDGTADAAMTFEGLLADVNAALADLTYLGDLDSNGPDTITVTADDLGNFGATGPLTHAATIDVNVAAINDAPLLHVPGPQEVDEDRVLSITGVGVEDTDVDEGSGLLGVSLATDHGTLSLGSTNGLTFTMGDGTRDSGIVCQGVPADMNAALAGLTYLGVQDFNGADEVRVRVDDLGNTGAGGAMVNSNAIPITVHPVNDTPIAEDDPNSPPIALDDIILMTSEDSTLIFTAQVLLENDTDVDGDALVVTSIGQPMFGVVEANGQNTYTYIPGPDFNGTDSFPYFISDTHGAGATAIVTVMVAAVNDGPVPNEDAAVTDEDTPVVIDVTTNDLDVDGDALTVDAVTAPAHGTAVINADGTVTYTPAAHYSGPDGFSYTVSDAETSSDQGEVSVTVIAVADAPLLQADDVSGDEAQTVPLNISAELVDTDGSESLSIVISGIPVGASLSAGETDGAGTWTVAPGELAGLMIALPGGIIADVQFTLTVTATATESSNGDSASTVREVEVMVNNVNMVPVAVCRDVFLSADSNCEATATPADLDGGSFDPDGDDITISTDPEGPYSSGQTMVTLTVTDEFGLSAACVALVTVENPCTLHARRDSYLRSSGRNANEGANRKLTLDKAPNTRVIVGFDLSGVSLEGLERAELVLTIDENENNWNSPSRVNAHALMRGWVEGNGWDQGLGVPGFGSGVTWNCPIDTDISDNSSDCPQDEEWNGGLDAAAIATAVGVTHDNGIEGALIWDVTLDVLGGASDGWLLKNEVETQTGTVSYYSREGAEAVGDENLGPRLLLHYAQDPIDGPGPEDPPPLQPLPQVEEPEANGCGSGMCGAMGMLNVAFLLCGMRLLRRKRR